MREPDQESMSSDSLDDLFEPALGDLPDDEFAELSLQSSDKQLLAEKRRRAEQRLEQKRLRDELGYYDMDFDDL